MGGFSRLSGTDAVPTADSTNNAFSRDVIGNKSDAAVTTVGTTKSIIAYLKGLVGITALTSTTSESGTDAQSTKATVYQLVASSAAAIRRITLAGSISDNDAAMTVTVFILTGPGASEVTRGQASIHFTAASAAGTSFHATAQINLPASTRVAWKFTTSTGNAAVYLGYTIEEA